MSKLPFKSARVRVPATTANLGPAFDLLGLAMDVWIDATLEVADSFEVRLTGRGAADPQLLSADNMIAKCAQKVIAMCTGDDTPVPLRLTVHSEVPMGCGCGSSSAAAVAGILAGFALAGSPKADDKAEILRLATEIEGHPDNAAPAIYGGLQLVYAAVPATAAPRSMGIPLPADLKVIIFVPHKAMKASTHQMRGLIPTEVSMGDAVHNMGRTAVIVAALALSQTERLVECMDDRFHQPQRATVYPHVRPCMDAAVAAGACYAFLSGAGPSVAAFVMGEDPAVHEAVMRAMDDAARAAGVEGACISTKPAKEGAGVIETRAAEE